MKYVLLLTAALVGAGPALADTTAAEASAEEIRLQNALNSARLRNGELTAELATLKKRLGLDNDNASLHEEIEALRAENRALRIHLAGALPPEPLAGTPIPGRDGGNRRTLLLLSALMLFSGVCLGLFVMD